MIRGNYLLVTKHRGLTYSASWKTVEHFLSWDRTAESCWQTVWLLKEPCHHTNGLNQNRLMPLHWQVHPVLQETRDLTDYWCYFTETCNYRNNACPKKPESRFSREIFLSFTYSETLPELACDYSKSSPCMKTKQIKKSKGIPVLE